MFLWLLFVWPNILPMLSHSAQILIIRVLCSWAGIIFVSSMTFSTLSLCLEYGMSLLSNYWIKIWPTVYFPTFPFPAYRLFVFASYVAYAWEVVHKEVRKGWLGQLGNTGGGNPGGRNSAHGAVNMSPCYISIVLYKILDFGSRITVLRHRAESDWIISKPLWSELGPQPSLWDSW